VLEGTEIVHDTQPVGTVKQLPRWSGQVPLPTVFGPEPGAGPAVRYKPWPCKTYLAPGMAWRHESMVWSQMVILLEDVDDPLTP